jgi:hypothetical protein
MAKRGRFDEVFQNGRQPSYCNIMYAAQTNTFYRSEIGYDDPRKVQVTWTSMGWVTGPLLSVWAAGLSTVHALHHSPQYTT